VWYNPDVAERAIIKPDDEYVVSRLIDYYLLGWERGPIFSPFDLRWVLLPTPPLRTDVEQAVTNLRQTRLAPFLEKAGLFTELSALPEDLFRERILRLRCYLAEPDEPSEELLNKLRLIASLSGLLLEALREGFSPLKLKSALRPLRKSLAVITPELHTLLYSLAEHLSLIGENSPEESDALERETRYRCVEWLGRLHAYWYALLG
jgi:hypothetical protein